MASSVRVIYDYHYSTVEGQPVHIHIGDQFQLLSKSSPNWWHVRRDSGQVPFYVPADCVEEIMNNLTISSRNGVSKSDSNLDRIMQSSSTAYDEPSADYYSSDTTGEGGDEEEEEQGECFDNPVYAVPSVAMSASLDSSRGSSEDEKDSRLSHPEYVNMRNALNSAPPLPNPDDIPVRSLDDWEEFEDALGRRYYYHPRTSVSSWKPPRRLMHLHNEMDCIADPSSKVEPPVMSDVSVTDLTSIQLRPSDDSISLSKDSHETTNGHPAASVNSIAVVEMETKVTAIIYSDLPPSPSPLPNNKTVPSRNNTLPLHNNTVHGRHVNFLHRYSRSNSGIDKIHPEEPPKESSTSVIMVRDLDNEKENTELLEKQKSASLPPPKRTPPSKDFNELRQLIANKMSYPETTKSVRPRSVLLLNESHMTEFDKLGPRTLGGMRNSKTLPSMLIGKTWRSDKSGVLQGFLNVTKFSENGRRLKKQWMPAFVVLMDATLFIFKPPFSLEQSPEIYVDLPGSTIKWSKEKSHRKNVFEIAGADGAQILIQDDNKTTCQDWVNNIVQTLARLGTDEPAPVKVLPVPNDPTKNERPLSPRIARLLSRTRSAKLRPDGQLGSPLDDGEFSLMGSQMQLSKKKKATEEMEQADNIKVKKIKIMERLKNFFSRRPTLESLKAKGIIRDGPVFGCNFIKLCEHEQSNVPSFVKRCIAAIEKKDMKADGIYRVSGNLSQVQKIRFQIDQDKYAGMDTEEDVNVLTGLLKLFFRELKEPMIPFNLYDPLMKANKMADKTSRDKRFRDLVNQIPGPNFETLRYLFQHLLRIAQYGDHNRMRLPNLAIVFGPTLMWPETPSMNLATDMLCQNQVVEHLLLNFHGLFENYATAT